MLTLGNISAGYGEVDIIKEISLLVTEGEIVTIAGTNGAGKSTLVKATMGLVPRVSGTMRFLDHNLLFLAPEERQGIGLSYVPQVANVFGTLTVQENLDVVEGIAKADKKRRIAEMYDMFPALMPHAKSYARSLSGGERQQLAFARALLPAPKLIVLDEPTAALSPALTDQVFAEIKRLPSHGVAVLIVEQRARQSLAISNRGYILDAGKVVISGSSDELLSNSDMAELYLGTHGGH